MIMDIIMSVYCKISPDFFLPEFQHDPVRQQCLRRCRTAHVPVDLYEPLIILHSRYCTEGPKSSPPKNLS